MKQALVLAAAIAALAASAPPAQAGTYDVWSCAGPAGEPLPANGWTATTHWGWGITSSSCGTRFGSLSAGLPDGQVPVGSYARWTFDAPPETTIDGITIHRTVGASHGYVTHWYRSYYLFRDIPVVAEGYVADLCIYLGGPCPKPGDGNAPFSEANHYSSKLPAQRIIVSAQCDGFDPCEPREFGARGHVTIYRARVSIADARPPAHRVPPTGSLLDTSGPIRGERSVNFDGTDAGGGLFSAEVVVDGESLAESRIAPDGGCLEPFQSPVPCRLNAAGTLSLDTATLENGHHRVQVALLDAARNRTMSDPVTVTVHNDKEPNGAGASRVARLTARLRSRGRQGAERVVRFGKTAKLVGRLADGAGEPIRGAELQVHSRIDRLGERERVVATVSTGAKGRYRWRTTKGPSRFIRIGYRAYKSDAGDAASAEVKLGVRPTVALRVTPRRVRNRGRITFRGRLVRGPGRGGVQVTIEAVGRNVRSRVPVTTLRTDRRGRFRFSYRFLRSFAPFRYRFRARLLRQASYPYAGGASRVVTVKIVR